MSGHVNLPWQVVFTHTRQEARACENLANQGFECFFPTFAKERRLHGKLAELQEPLFPRYVFIRARNPETAPWAAVRSTRGVLKLVRFGTQMAQVPNTLIAALQQQIQKREALFAKGDTLKIVGGAFSGMEAEVEKMMRAPNGEMRVLVLLEILSKPQKLAFPVRDVEKIA